MAQISLETQTKLSPENVIEEAKKTFVDNYGLELIEEADCCLRLEGGGGFVFIRAESQEVQTKVILEGQEWTYQLKSFMKKIAS